MGDKKILMTWALFCIIGHLVEQIPCKIYMNQFESNSQEIAECDLNMCESNINERFQNNSHASYGQVSWFY